MKQLIYGFLFMAFSVQAQIGGTVTDSVSGQPVPYVNIWIEQSPEAASSDEVGNFSISAKPGAVMSFSAVGYETKKTTVPETGNIDLKLKAITYTLDAVTIAKPKQTLEASLGGYKKSDIDMYYSIGDRPHMYARYFPATKDFSKTPYLKELTLVTSSQIKNAKFNVHFLEVNPDGTPGAEMGTTNILGIARKGKQETSIDLVPYRLRFPEEGFFIAVEVLIVPENKYVESYLDKKHIKHEQVYYAPTFGVVRTETNNSWGFRDEHSWEKFQEVSAEKIRKYYDDYKKATGKDAPRFDDRRVEFAMKLTVTN